MVQRTARRRLALAALASLLLTWPASAQQKPLTVDDIYSYEGWARFNGTSTATMSWAPSDNPWLSETHYLWPGTESTGGPWQRVDARTGATQALFTTSQVEAALIRVGVSASDARSAMRRRPSNFNATKDAFLLTIDEDLYVYDVAAAAATRLTSSDGEKSEATFSPDGRAVAFVKNHNLHVVRRAGLAVQDPPYVDVQDPPYVERALTTDGTAELLNGTLDWVYSEELYGRGTHRAFWWSPDSSHLAFIQLDEKPVPEYTLVDDIPYYPALERWDYPKAGDPNPIARLGSVAVSDGTLRWIDTSRYSDFLIVNVGWTPDSRSVIYQVQDRQQTWLDLNRADLATSATSTLLRETSKTWVERWQDESADPVWLKDGSFLWLSERSGWRHVYHYSPAGALIRQVTRGEWEVRQLHGLDLSETLLYFSATQHSPIGLDLYRIGLDGARSQRLSTKDGRHRPYLSPSRGLFLDSWSDVGTPPQVRLHAASSGEMLRVAEENPVPALKEYAWSAPELLQVRARDGFLMEAMMIKPPDFDPSKRYPVYQFTYAGPHAQQVVNRWGSLELAYHQLLAQRGIIVWIMDNRTASGKGVQSAWPLYRNFGATELNDLEDGVAWLKAQPYVDGSRIGLSGVSYGGFMTLHAMTHSTSFVMGIAEGAVTDWRNYDTIYTERYMGLPKDNAEGYRQSSPRFSAARLSGNLLLIHSTLDDNVHPQNAVQFAYELQKAGKPFQMMMYPKSAHGVSDPQLALHLRRMMLDFTVKNLVR